MTSTTTPSTPPPPATSQSDSQSLASVLTTVMTTMERMQRESQKETKDLVLSILQGRQQTTSGPPDEQLLIEQLRPPNYDSDTEMPLPTGIQAIFEREESEAEELRQLNTERDVLSSQLRNARLRVIADPQGPGSMTS